MTVLPVPLRRLARSCTRLRRAGWAAAMRLVGRTVRPRVIFIGDSLTHFWADEDPWLFRPGRADAGVPGETTGAMLARFGRDVIGRRPRAVHVMGGTNDLWHGCPGPEAVDALANISAMAEAACGAGIRVILAAPPPIGEDAALMFGQPHLLARLRAGVERIAREGGHVLVDYAPALTDEEGRLRPRFTTDGVHFTRAGYRAMRPTAAAVIAAALRRG